MKIIHCSDLHLDSPLSANFTYEIAEKRNMEIFDTFKRLVKYAEDNNIQHIILAGDVFDTEKISNRTEQNLKNLIEKYENINFYYLSGNHDINHKFLDSYKNNLPKNLKTFSNTWQKYTINNRVNIIGIEIDKLNKPIIFNDLESKINIDKINIVIMHGDVKNKNEEEINNIDIKKLKNKNIDYLALGHLHSYSSEKLDNRGIYCYSGCLEGRGFDESGDKGFIELEIKEDKIVTHKFVKYAYRTIHWIKWKVEDNNELDWYTWVNKKINDLEKNENISNKDIVRIELIGNINIEKPIDIKYVQNELEKLQENKRIFYIDKIKDSLKKIIDYEKYKNNKSLIGVFINKVKKDPQLSEDEKAKIIQLGYSALWDEKQWK